MNHQTPGPIAVKGTSRGLFAAPTIRNPDGLIAATRFLGSGIDAQEEHWANAELLAASYTSFDKAGRELGVDAVELARSLDIATLIRERDQAREALQACQVFITPLARRQNWNEYKEDAADRIRSIIGTAH